MDLRHGFVALALPALTGFGSPRAWAFGLIGIHEYLRRLSGDSLVNQTRETLVSRLMQRFEASAHADYLFPHVRDAITDAFGRAGIEDVFQLDGIETHDCFTTTRSARPAMRSAGLY